jgi:hypothetical protein
MLLIIILLSLVIFFLLIWLVALILQARSDDKAFWKLATLAMDMNNANKDALDNCHDIISTNKKLLEEQRKTLDFNKQLTACVNAMARELDKNHIAFDVDKYFPDITSETLAATTDIAKSDPEGRENEDETITSQSFDCPCDCTDCGYTDKCVENGRYDSSGDDLFEEDGPVQEVFDLDDIDADDIDQIVDQVVDNYKE